MPVVLLLAAIAILAGVVVVAIGRGGELTIFRSDVPPLRPELATAADMARFRPPPAFFGYSAQVTDDALQRIARTVADREAELASLRRQLAALRASSPPASPLSAAAGVADASIPPAPPPKPGGWPESGGWPEPGGWAESEPEPESGGWPESEGGSGPEGWAESGPEAGTGPSGWDESGFGSGAGTGPAGWSESESGIGPSGWDEPGPEGGSEPGWTGSGAWPEADTAAEPGTGTVTHGEELDPGPGPEPGLGGAGR
jgi:hypothetical protein